jgi:lipoprotein-anchoring transpeptidase ErfK/SrfK
MIFARIRVRLVAVLALLGVLVVLVSCGSGSLAETTVTSTVDATPAPDGSASSSAASSSSSSPSPTTTSERPPVATVSATPAFGAADVSVVDPITISVAKGTIDALTLTNPDGEEVMGAFAPDGTSWTTGEVLGFGKIYTAAGTATGSDGKQVPIAGTFTTVAPATQVRSTINPVDGAVVGVAAPVTVSFGVEPEDRALIQQHVSITTTPQVEGAWGWVQHDDGRWGLDFRPRDYWPAGTQIHVDAKLYGLRFAEGAYGATDLTTDFTIGRNQVVVADVNSFAMVVKQDGVEVARYPASYGRGGVNGDPALVTRSGIHVVTEKAPEYKMNNPRYGYTDSLQRWVVRISNNGEFIHANPASAEAQGAANVTHGCVNLSLADAEAYYNSAIWGDPVEVSGTDVQLGPEDGDIYIWGLTWDQWLERSAL